MLDDVLPLDLEAIFRFWPEVAGPTVRRDLTDLSELKAPAPENPLVL